MLYIVKVPSIKVTESETSFIKGKQNSNQFKLRSFHSCLPQILLGPSLNTFPQIISPLLTHFGSTCPFYTPSEQGLICSETYSGSCQTSKMERFAQSAPSWMSGMVMDMPLLSMSGI